MKYSLLIFAVLVGVKAQGLGANWTAPPLQSQFNSPTQMDGMVYCGQSSQAVTTLGGFLRITAAKTPQTCNDENLDMSLRNGPFSQSYISEQIYSSSFTFTYGTIAFRAKVPIDLGTWPTIWLYGAPCQSTFAFTTDNIGSCNWPTPPSTEIDMLEQQGSNVFTTSTHSSLGNGTCAYNTHDPGPTWHVYSIVWSPGSVVSNIDGAAVCTISGSMVPADPMFVLISLFVSNAFFVGTPNPATFPEYLDVDYLTITQGSTVIFNEQFNETGNQFGSVQAR